MTPKAKDHLAKNCPLNKKLAWKILCQYFEWLTSYLATRSIRPCAFDPRTCMQNFVSLFHVKLRGAASLMSYLGLNCKSNYTILIQS